MKKEMINYKEQLKNINTFIFDYDGVLTDGTVILMNDGDAIRTANVKDGYAIQLAVKKNYNVAIISGGNSQSIIQRFKALKVKDVFIGVENKMNIFNEYLLKKNVKPVNVLYMGDDIPDYGPMLKAGIATCPSDASQEIKSISKYISGFKGGKGCVRDIIEQVLKIQGKWMNDDAFHW